MAIKFSSQRPLTDEEEAQIQKMIESDPDNPEITDEQIKQMKPFAEVFPDLAESIKRARGRPRKENAKEAVTIRLTPQALAAFKASGPNWRNHMGEILEKAAKKESLRKGT